MIRFSSHVLHLLVLTEGLLAMQLPNIISSNLLPQAKVGKPHPAELRQRVVDHVADGNTRRATAARFKVSVRLVNDMVKLKAATGGLGPKPQGNGGGHGKFAALKGWLARRIGEKRDLTAAALAAEIVARVAYGQRPFAAKARRVATPVGRDSGRDRFAENGPGE
jgi:transposase